MIYERDSCVGGVWLGRLKRGGCFLFVVAEVALEAEEAGFVKVIAEQRDRDGGSHDYAGSGENSEGFGVEMVADVETSWTVEHRLEGVVEDVDAIAVFAEEAKGAVGEELLGL